MPKFSEQVLEVARKIPRGKVATYADIARAAGSPRAARAAGSALRKNRTPIIIPCHRVVRSDGLKGNYSWKPDKSALLRSEGVEVVNGSINLKKFRATLQS